MNQELKQKLSSLPKSKCSICNTFRSYTNPLAKCSGCGKKYCYDHINAINGKNGIEDWCDRCLE